MQVRLPSRQRVSSFLPGAVFSQACAHLAARASGRTREEVQGDEGPVVRVANERVQPPLLQVPHRHHARAATRRHQRHPRACDRSRQVAG